MERVFVILLRVRRALEQIRAWGIDLRRHPWTRPLRGWLSIEGQLNYRLFMTRSASSEVCVKLTLRRILSTILSFYHYFFSSTKLLLLLLFTIWWTHSWRWIKVFFMPHKNWFHSHLHHFLFDSFLQWIELKHILGVKRRH